MLDKLRGSWSNDETVAEVIERVWYEFGIRHLPMIPGGPLMELLDVVYRRGGIAPCLVGHEQAAALMAEGYFRASGRMAAVAVTAGPGLTNTTTGVAVACREQTPFFLISAQVASHQRGWDAAQELNTVDILKPITKASVELSDPRRTEAIVRDLLELALRAPFGPVHLSVPTDLFGKRVAAPMRCERKG